MEEGAPVSRGHGRAARTHAAHRQRLRTHHDRLRSYLRESKQHTPDT
jgi:hypothetical protein